MALLGYLCMWLSNNRVLLFIIAFFSQFHLVSGLQHNLVVKIFNSIMASCGWFLYVLLNWYFDFIYRNFIEIHGTLFDYRRILNYNYFIDRFILSIVFFIDINLGVFFSTAFWNIVSFENTRTNIVFAVISCILSYLSVVGWIYLARISFILPNPYYVRHMWQISLFRSILESVAFNFISWYNFYIWSCWNSVNYANYIAMAIGPIFLTIGIYQVYLEQTLTSPWIYGLVYQASFTMLSFTTSGYFYAYSAVGLVNSTSWNVGIGLASTIVILLLPLEVYRQYIVHVNSLLNQPRTLQRFNWRARLAARYFITFLAFVLFTSSIINLMPWWV